LTKTNNIIPTRSEKHFQKQKTISNEDDSRAGKGGDFTSLKNFEKYPFGIFIDKAFLDIFIEIIDKNKQHNSNTQ